LINPGRSSPIRDVLAATLLRGSAISLILTGLGQGLAFLQQAFFARQLGATEYGLFSYALAWVGVAVVGCKLGFDVSLVRFVPLYGERGQPGSLCHLVRYSRRTTVFFSAGVAILAAAATVSFLPSDDPRLWPLLIAWVVLPLAVTAEVGAATLRAMRKIALALSVDSVLRPLAATIAAAVLLAVLQTRTSFVAIAAVIVATALTSALALLLVARQLPVPDASPAHKREWLTTSIPLMLAGGLQVLLYSADTLLIGALRGATEAGVYYVATRIASISLFAMNATQVIAAPLMAQAFVQGRQQDLQRVVTLTVGCSLLLAVPLCVAMYFFGPEILGLFGAGFDSAYLPVLLLLAAQLFNVATGPTGYLLSVTGHQQKLVAFMAAGVAVNLALNVFLIPRYGMTGAASAALVAHVFWNTVAARFAWKRLGINSTAIVSWRAAVRSWNRDER